MNILIRKILCPVDFSESSEHARRYAVVFARIHGAELYLLHVIQPPVVAVSDSPGLAGLSDQIVRDLEQSARARLRQVQEQTEKEHAQVTSRIVVGTPFVEIVQAARETQADLIVMGTHGRTGLTHMIIGSVAEKVVRKAPCPVLTVRLPEQKFVMP
jgi:nucleotide-binding universal stress UspA family protein